MSTPGTHYQMTHSTMYPETRRLLSKIHAERAVRDMLVAPGWAIMSDDQRDSLMAEAVQSSDDAMKAATLNMSPDASVHNFGASS